MKCRKCGIEIYEDEIFCDDCKKELKSISSRSEVNELERLIEEQKSFSNLENTKELYNLDDLNEELEKNIEENNSTQIFEMVPNQDDKEGSISEKIEEKNDFPKHSESEIKQKSNKKSNTKKIIIIIGIVIALIIVVLTLFYFNRSRKNNSIEIDYKNIINGYGKLATKKINEYMETNDKIPNWKDIKDINYNNYSINCDIHEIYEDGNIYLASCKVDKIKTKYTYGKKQQIKQVGEKINIYNNNGVFTNVESSNLVGTITCETKTCEYYTAFNKHVIVIENDNYYLYNYETDEMQYGPFQLNKLLEYNNNVYGLLVDKNSIYNINTNKLLSNIKGSIEDNQIMYKYGYAIFNNNSRHEFVNLKTGNVSYYIEDTLKEFIEDTKNNIVYITSTTTNNKIKIYNSNGKALFGDKEYNDFKFIEDNLIVSTLNNFYVYGTDLNLKVSSKRYDRVLEINDKYIVVINNSHLELLHYNDSIYTTFDFIWDDSKYKFISSKWENINDKYGIYVLIKNLNNEYKYYYIPSTNETDSILVN